MMSTPVFWYRQKTSGEKLLKLALLPVSAVYGWVARKRFDLYFPVPMEKPVICVGNIVAGGAGKTPVSIALAELLKDKGYNPHLLTRGFGGTEAGPLQVSTGRDTAHDVGDEALLLVDAAPTWVAHNRPLGAQAAIDSGASIVVMDDGFQNPVIYKDISFVVIDGGVGFGNKAVMPAGPLREDLRTGLSRADAAIIVGEDKTGAAECIRKRAEIPILHARLVPAGDNPDVRGKKIHGFAGIGRPRKFRETLEAEGAIIEGWNEFPDHYPYDEEDLQEILDEASKTDAVPMTTAKDFVRVPEAMRDRIQKFSVRLQWDDPNAVLPLIESILRKRGR